MEIRSYRDLKVWQKAMDLVVESYRVARTFPVRETYGLRSQIERASTSIPANIAEGHGRDHLGDYLHHLSVANGSLMELETHLIIANRLHYLTSEELEPLLTQSGEISRMLSGLTKTLKVRQHQASHVKAAAGTPNT